MKLAHRFVYYLGGFAIGIVILIFFVGGSGAKCEYDYGPDARVLKNIRNKERVFSNNAQQFLAQSVYDTATISKALKEGDVIFSESNTSLDSCNVYVIAYKIDNVKLKFEAENCNKTATLSNFETVN